MAKTTRATNKSKSSAPKTGKTFKPGTHKDNGATVVVPDKAVNIAEFPDYDMPLDWIDEGFTAQQWIELTKQEKFAFYEDPDGEVARAARRDLRALQQPAASGEIVTRDQPAAEVPANNQLMATNDSGREALLSIVGGVTTEQLKEALQVQTEQRALIKQFIQQNLEEGIDYGKIHVIKDCPAYKRGNCQTDYHYSKSILMKPGQEKIFSLFGITDELTRDDDAYEMFPDIKGLVAYKCVMYRGGNKVGEGGGAATLSGSQGDPNSAIKKARKRAKMDACLSLGFSAYFTQDLDDPEYKAQREMMNSKAAAEAENRDKDEFGLMPRDPAAPIDAQEREILYRMTLKAGFAREEIVDLLRVNGITAPDMMTSGQARDMMAKLRSNAFAAPTITPKVPDDVITDFNDQDPAIALSGAEEALKNEPVVIPEPEELEIDDEFKSQMHERFTKMGLNANGEMWFKKYVSGRPFGDFDKFTDDNWRKTYNLLDLIAEGHVEVPERYIAGLISSDPAARDPSEPEKNQPQAQTMFNDVSSLFPGAKPA